MQTRIGQVRIRYRVPAGQSAATALASLQSVAQQKIADSCDQAFANVFEDDPTVYVLRRVSSRVAVLAKQPTSDASLAEQWGRSLCKSVVRTIVRNDDDDNLVRFDDQAQFVSNFLTRLTLGDAWDRWYFGAFHNYRGLPPEEIVISVLEENHEIVVQILGRLRQANSLDQVLGLLSQRGQRHLWEKVIRSAPIDEQTVDAFRIFAQAAFGIADLLALWRANQPTESDLLEAYLRTKPVTPNWTNGTSLADAVSTLLRFMVDERLLNISSTPTDEEITELRELLSSKFDWLDATHLFNSVLSIFKSPQFSTTTRQFTLRPRQATPAQVRILEELLARLQSKNLNLAFDNSRVHETLLRLIAAVSDSTDAAAISATTGVLESVVMTALAIQRSDRPQKALRQLLRGEMPPGLTIDGDIALHLKSVVEAGDAAQRLVMELVQGSLESSYEEGIQIESDCVGVFLLVRVIQDLRLIGKVRECGGEPIQPLLAALAVVVFRDKAWTNEVLEPGVAIWSGFDPTGEASLLASLESLNLDQLTTAIIETVLAQRLIDPPEALESTNGSSVGAFSEQTVVSLSHIVTLLLKAWAHWVPGLRNSSTNYLLDNFIRRSGKIIVNEQRITVELDRKPLDEILKLSGYLDDTPPVAWLQNRTVRYRFSK